MPLIQNGKGTETGSVLAGTIVKYKCNTGFNLKGDHPSIQCPMTGGKFNTAKASLFTLAGSFVWGYFHWGLCPHFLSLRPAILLARD